MKQNKKHLSLFFLCIFPSNCAADGFWDVIREHWIASSFATVAILGTTAVSSYYGAKAARDMVQTMTDEIVENAAHIVDQQMLPAAQLTGKELVSHTSAELTLKVLPAARETLQTTSTHITTELKSVIKLTFIAGLCLLSAGFGLKLMYNNINEHEGKFKSSQTLKMCIGLASIAIASYIFHTQFEQD